MQLLVRGLNARQWIFIGAGYAAAYALLFLVGRYTIGLIEFSLWFPAAGLRFAALLIFGWRFAFIAALGELAVQGLLDEWSKWPPGFSLQMVSGITGPPLIYGLVAGVLQRAGLTLRPFTFSHTLWLLVAALGAPALTAPVSTGFLHLAGRLPMEAFWPATLSFWVGDAVGIFMLAPALVAIWLGHNRTQGQHRPGGEQNGETTQKRALMEIGGVLAATVSTFGLLGMPAHPTFWYPMFLPVVILTMRHAWLGAIPAVFAFNIMAAWIAAGLNDPFQRLDLQVFLVVLSATGLLMAALVRDRERSEELKLKQIRQLARFNRRKALSDMASSVVHELSGPVATLSINARKALLEIERNDLSEQEFANSIAMLRDDADRLGKVFQSIKQMGRRQSDGWERLDLHDVLNNAGYFLKATAKLGGQRIVLDIPEYETPVFADRVLLEQAVLNVARNGLQSMDAEPGGELRMSLSQSEAEAVILISDQGGGITAIDPERVFEAGLNPTADGMGIGLSITRKILEQHGGSIELSETGGNGTTFVIRLPLVQ